MGCAALLAAVTLLGGCSGGAEPLGNPSTPVATITQDTTPAPSEVPATDTTSQEAPQGGESSAPPADRVSAACPLLDPAFLNDTLAGQKTTFGTDFEFVEPMNTTSERFCQWPESSTGLSLELRLEPTAETDPNDHSERAYNIDSPPVAVPQDGPGTQAVLLTDASFEDSDLDGFPYGYFFVQGDMTAYIKSVGLTIEPESLRDIADEVSRRMLEA